MYITLEVRIAILLWGGVQVQVVVVVVVVGQEEGT